MRSESEQLHDEEKEIEATLDEQLEHQDGEWKVHYAFMLGFLWLLDAS